MRTFAWADGADSWAAFTTHLGCPVRERVLTLPDGSQRHDIVLGGRPVTLTILSDREISGKVWRA
jgi:hypothetical protein